MKIKERFKFFAIIILPIFFSVALAHAQKATDVMGQYFTPKKDGKIEIFKVGDEYFGKFIWGKNPRKDTKNPQANLRTRELVGLIFLTNFTYDDGEYKGGEIYDPETGKTYTSKMWLKDGDLKVRGFVGISLFGRTEVFTRLQ